MSEFFSSDQPIITASAPGRLDVMGGISDYSGSLLLQMPIKETTTVRIQQRADLLIQVKSIISKDRVDLFSIDSSALSNNNYAELSSLLHKQNGGDWAAYVLGCITVLHVEKNLPLHGLNISIESSVPVGKGVSSSAALEVATMCALVKLYQLTIDNTELPLLAQKAENLVVGAPCGLMDQLTSYLGHKNKLLPLICQPHSILPAISIPSAISFCAMDSGIRHAVTGASYSDVRTAAFMAYTIIALKEGSSINDLQAARSSNDWNQLPFKGFLANITPSQFESAYRELLPEAISGTEFLEKYELSIDTVTHIISDKLYRLRACAAHPVMENFRIQSFTNLLKNFTRQKDKKETLQLLGEMMFQSHAGYNSVGLGSTHTDEIVQRVRAAGADKQVYGARITGGGSGGTVCILCYGQEGKQTAKQIFEEYRKEHNIRSFFFAGSSEGAKTQNEKFKM